MHLSTRISTPLHQNSLAGLKSQLVAEGRSILDFSESNPYKAGISAFWNNDSAAWPGFGTQDEPHSALALPETLEYLPDPQGILAAREAVASWLGGFSNDRDFSLISNPVLPPAGLGGSRNLTGGDMFLCASTSEAYGWLFKLLCDPGDAILVPRPGYPLFEYLAGLESVYALPYMLEYRHPGGWSIDLEALEDVLAGRVQSRASVEPRPGKRIRAIVLINPNNPTGSYVSAAERERIVELCARYEVAIIADEVFFEFDIEPRAGRRRFAGEERVLTFALGGLSKLAGLPGYKLGWIALSGPTADLAEAHSRLEIIADSYLSAGTPVMKAAAGILARAPAFIGQVRQRLRRNLAILREELEYEGSPHRVLRCEGGWTALIHSPALEPEEHLARRLLSEESVWAHPGYFFDVEREAHFAASLILNPDRTREAARRYRRCFESLAL